MPSEGLAYLVGVSVVPWHKLQSTGPKSENLRSASCCRPSPLAIPQGCGPPSKAGELWLSLSKAGDQRSQCTLLLGFCPQLSFGSLGDHLLAIPCLLQMLVWVAALVVLAAPCPGCGPVRMDAQRSGGLLTQLLVTPVGLGSLRTPADSLSHWLPMWTIAGLWHPRVRAAVDGMLLREVPAAG